jgi:uncharacterized protein
MIVDIEKAQPGMRLLEDVLLPSGAILVNASQVLTASLIETIARRGIQKIQVVPEKKEVQSDPQGSDAAESAECPPAESSVPSEAQHPAGPTPPKLKVMVSKDAMSAKLSVEPTGAADAPLSKDAVASALSAEGVVFGIDDKVVIGAIEKWMKFKRYYEFDNIARGAPPQAAKEGTFDCAVRFVSTPEKFASVKKIRSFKGLAAEGIDCERVDPGTEVARKQKDLPAVPGTTVKGDPVSTSERIESSLALDASVEFGPDKKNILAKATGIVYIVNNVIGVHPVNFDGSIELSVSTDKMKAEASLYPPGERGAPLSRAQLSALLSDNKIVYGIKEAEIGALLTDCANGRYPKGPATVAEGKKPVSGENGSVEFLFNRETSLKPKVNPNGSVDYKDVQLVASVKKGQELARLVPPRKGTPGKNVLGQDIPCVDGAPAKLPMGQNTGPGPADSGVLVATTDGNVKFNGTVVEISEGFIIKGNVDFSTGNINYAKSVVIGGDVASGFKVQCGGDLQVTGTIEDAEVVVGGNVLCKLGFVGQGKGCIDAKGDVNLAFMKNQTVKSRQNVVIAKEALNCSVYARKSISAHGNPLSIAGGKMMARDAITVYSVGNQSGVKTVLEVGADFSLLDEMEKTEGQLAEITENKRKLMHTFAKYEKMAEHKKGPGNIEETMLQKLKIALEKFDQQIKALEERKKIVVTNVYEFKNAHIKIEHAALPGTVFKIGTRLLQVKEEVIGPKTVRLIDEEIKII